MATTRLRFACWAVIVASLVTAAYAARHRPPWSDEGQFASAAYNLARNNAMGTPVLVSHGNGIHLTRIEQHTYWVFPGLLVGEGLWYKVFPSTIFWTRAYTIAWFGVLLMALFAYLRKLLPDSTAPWLALLLLAGNFIAVDNAAFARPEVSTCALGISAMAVYVRWREQHFHRALLAAHTLAALSGMTHPNGIFHWVAFMALILWLDRSRIRVSSVLAALAPYVLLGAVWGLYLMQDPQGVRDQLTANMISRVPASRNPLSLLAGEFDRYWLAYGWFTGGLTRLKIFSLILHWSAVVGCLWIGALRRNPGVQLLLVQVALYFTGLTVFNQKMPLYLTHIIPVYAAVSAVWLAWLWEHHAILRRPIQLGLACIVALELGGIALKSYERSQVATQRAAIDFIRKQAKPDARINGTAALLFGMDFDPRLIDDSYLGIETGQVPDIIVVEQLYRMLYAGWKEQRPEAMRQVEDRFSGYRLSFRAGDYEIWTRKQP